jgi:hypothetical protein
MRLYPEESLGVVMMGNTPHATITNSSSTPSLRSDGRDRSLQREHYMELDTFLVSLYVLVDDWLRERHRSALARLSRPTLLSEIRVCRP